MFSTPFLKTAWKKSVSVESEVWSEYHVFAFSKKLNFQFWLFLTKTK